MTVEIWRDQDGRGWKTSNWLFWLLEWMELAIDCIIVYPVPRFNSTPHSESPEVLLCVFAALIIRNFHIRSRVDCHFARPLLLFEI